MRRLGTLKDIKMVERIGLLALMLPILPALVLLSFSMVGWYQVGHFPSYGNPDPKAMGMGVLRSGVAIFTLLSPYLLLLGDFCAVLFLLISGLQRHCVLRNLFTVLLANSFYFWIVTGFPLCLDLASWIVD